KLLTVQQGFRFFFRLLRGTRRTGKHALQTDINVEQLDAVVRENELANLVRVSHAPRLEHPDTAVALSVAFDAAQENPSIHQRRNADLRLLEGTSSLRQAGKKGRNLLRFEKIYQAGQHRFDFQSVAQRNVTRDWVDDDNFRFCLRYHLV